MLQFAHCTEAPQLRQRTDHEYPRRLISTSACVLNDRHSAIASCKVFEIGLVWCVCWKSWRRSTISTAASERFSTRVAIVSSSYLPFTAQWMGLRERGVGVTA